MNRTLLKWLCLIFVINLIGIYCVFYYNPSYSILDIGSESCVPITWNSEGEKIAFLKNFDGFIKARVYDFQNKKFKDYPVNSLSEVSFRDNIVFSPDAKKIVYITRIGNDRIVSLLNLDSSTVSTLEDILIYSNLSTTSTGRPIKTVFWLDNDRLIYENKISFKRNGIIIVDLKTGEELLFIKNGLQPSLSNDKTKIAYIVMAEGGIKFNVKVLNLLSNKTITLAENVETYLHSIRWSPTDAHIARGYSQVYKIPDKANIVGDKIAIIDMDKNFSLVSGSKLLASPEWIDENNILMAEYKTSGIVLQSKTIKGLYLYNIKTRDYKKISSKIRSLNYYISPDRKTLVSSLGTRGFFVLNLERLLYPTKIDKLRTKLGIVNP
ncbi:MAG: hypothetical protein KAI55_02315 [Candidatus Aenigmarchaeota archaeon]|nr:hypothetical protein [Candidatus Aenigmarchaeota archaeon]